MIGFHVKFNVIYSGKFVFRHPATTSANIFIQPFSRSVWATLLVSILFVATLLYLSLRASFVVKLVFEETTDTSAQNSMLITLGILTQQGFDLHNIILFSTRIIILSMVLLSILVYQYYSSYIVGSLLITPPRTINTLTDLINSNLKVGVEDLSYNKDYFETTTDPVALKLYNKKMVKGYQCPNYLSINEGINKMQKGGFAFHFGNYYYNVQFFVHS